MIICNFVPAATTSHRKNDAISDVFAQMQTKTMPIAWPNIDSSPVNKFYTPGYITHAFLTLYPYGTADLCSECIRIVKLVKYF